MFMYIHKMMFIWVVLKKESKIGEQPSSSRKEFWLTNLRYIQFTEYMKPVKSRY